MNNDQETQTKEEDSSSPESINQEHKKLKPNKMITFVVSALAFILVTYGIVINFSHLSQNQTKPTPEPIEIKTETTQAPETSEPELPQEDIVIETGEATFSAGKQLSVQELPREIPIYPNASTRSQVSTAAGSTTELISQDNFLNVSKYYQNELISSNWTITETTEIENAVIFEIEKGNSSGAIIINQSSSGTQITIDISQKNS